MLAFANANKAVPHSLISPSWPIIVTNSNSQTSLDVYGRRSQVSLADDNKNRERTRSLGARRTRQSGRVPYTA